MKKSMCALMLVAGLCSTTLPLLAPAASPKPKPKPKPAVTAPAKPAAPAAEAKKPAQEPGIIDTSYREVEPLSLLKDVDKWVGEKVSMQATFVAFSPFALDYKGAMRPAKDYISFLIQRPDVTHHVIPLSELKLIYARKKADKVIDLESGDKVLVKGKVFSAALGDPWVDVDEVVLLKKSPENVAKSKKKAKKKEIE